MSKPSPFEGGRSASGPEAGIGRFGPPSFEGCSASNGALNFLYFHWGGNERSTVAGDRGHVRLFEPVRERTTPQLQDDPVPREGLCTDVDSGAASLRMQP
jgi:hypothetical protein